MEIKKIRNEFVDVLRGIAMLMVVLGHTMTSSTSNSEESFLFNFIWALQMPLFIIISGYIVRYSRIIDSTKSFFDFIKRRTLAYLLPWLVWSLLIKGIAFGQSSYLNIKWLVFHMDSGYWFLFSIWTINVIFGLSQFIAFKFVKGKSESYNLIFTLLFYIAGFLILAFIGWQVGLSFLCIKLTLYYMPFYIAGYIFGKFQDRIYGWKYGESIIEAIVAIGAIVFLSVVLHINLYTMSESVIGIAVRAFTSLIGSISICGLLCRIKKNRLYSLLAWVGIHSLEIYLIHNFLLSIIKSNSTFMFSSPQGMALVLCNFIITVILSVLLAKLINNNKYTKLFLLGKR